MKRIFLLPITFSLLTACQEPSKIDVTPYVPHEIKTEELVFEGSSGIVSVAIADSENEAPVLPPQISVSFEKQADDYKNLIVESFDGGSTELLFSKQVHTRFFGCNDADQETVLPRNIDAARVVLCGKIKIPSNGFRMRVSQLELRNAELSSLSLHRDEVDYTSPYNISIYTANLTLTGANKFVLEGFEKGRERERAPALFMRLAKVWGPGTIEIFSRKSVKIRTY